MRISFVAAMGLLVATSFGCGTVVEGSAEPGDTGFTEHADAGAVADAGTLILEGDIKSRQSCNALCGSQGRACDANHEWLAGGRKKNGAYTADYEKGLNICGAQCDEQPYELIWDTDGSGLALIQYACACR